MFKKLIGVAALYLALYAQVVGQDIVCGALLIKGVGSKQVAHIKIANTHRTIAAPVRVYVELHSLNDRDNPIAQFRYSKSRLNGWSASVLKVPFKHFKYRPGFNRSDAKKLVVLCDPKNEVNETNENNNNSQKILFPAFFPQY